MKIELKIKDKVASWNCKQVQIVDDDKVELIPPTDWTLTVFFGGKRLGRYHKPVALALQVGRLEVTAEKIVDGVVVESFSAEPLLFVEQCGGYLCIAEIEQMKKDFSTLLAAFTETQKKYGQLLAENEKLSARMKKIESGEYSLMNF